jgi:hypothetical protein
MIARVEVETGKEIEIRDDELVLSNQPDQPTSANLMGSESPGRISPSCWLLSFTLVRFGCIAQRKAAKSFRCSLREIRA